MSVPVSTLDQAALQELAVRAGLPRWRGTQLHEAVWRPGASTLDEVRQLPAAARTALGAEVRFSTAEVAAESEADGGATVKLLVRLEGGLTVETVAMETAATAGRSHRGTVCVSTQVGCAVGCPFCATGRAGLRRSCTAAEIVDQVRAAGAALHRRGLGPVTHVVYMGMGEPLANYDATVASLRLLTREAGIGARRITVSTSGVVPAIDRLAAEGMPVTLAISLHAADDALRDRLVPLNRAHPIAALMAAGTGYAEATGRRLSLEWCLIGGINDSEEQAARLRGLAHAARAHVNVIPMNHVDGSPWGPPDRDTTRRFLAALRGVRTTVRDTRGAGTEAACGQLRASLEPRRALLPDGTLGPPRRAVSPRR
ncbi:MAG TPA: 23S rRNA (adenine(2503)-C(2))-methyltransferase RlmN [Candidatus Dormibacteraeota bacterium]|jgi:23S rRNA (adenine2503-C2)-methyltransferase|nr:23S rRNA (adenine(2503)-C(2))-methyltransferase RlmN [Candidatus Dormibacteraeota bacterium]